MTDPNSPAGNAGCVVLTMGEPAGVGGELTLRAWLQRRDAVPPFVAVDDADRLADMAGQLGWSVPVRVVETPAQASEVFPIALPVLHRPLPCRVDSGRPTPETAAAVVAAIETAVSLVRSHQAAAVVTNPIQKSVLYAAGFRFPGHTEFLASLSGGTAKPVMMLAGPSLRVVPVTIHVSLRDALDTITTAAIVETGSATAAALTRDFGISEPKLAVAGLNPHAGEDGALGEEEARIVAPAVSDLQRRGIDAFGPVPPDTLFTPQARGAYDAAMCLYHDQALIPIKALDFDRTVNVTLGLPFVRTSPDHGTALDIAGTGRASPDSLIAALRMAWDISQRRRVAA